MNPALSKKAINTIEALCEQGCTHVNRLLEQAENGNSIEELSEFSSKEVEQIIEELAQLMSVYDENSDNSDSLS